MDSFWGYTIAGYMVTGAAIGAYVGSLYRRARRARGRAAAVAAREARSRR